MEIFAGVLILFGMSGLGIFAIFQYEEHMKALEAWLLFLEYVRMDVEGSGCDIQTAITRNYEKSSKDISHMMEAMLQDLTHTLIENWKNEKYYVNSNLKKEEKDHIRNLFAISFYDVEAQVFQLSRVAKRLEEQYELLRKKRNTQYKVYSITAVLSGIFLVVLFL